jgi:outer membrane biosynthesis protein TonB
VLVPLTNLESTAMLLRLAQTSMWDKNNDENEAKGYYAWDQYLDMLRARGCTHTGLVATKVRFDSRVAYPKLLFAASRWLEDEEIADVKPRFESEDVLKLLNASEDTAASRKPVTPKDDDEPAPPPKKAKAAPPPAEDEDEPAPPPKKKAAPVEETDDAPPPKKAKAAAPPPAEEEDEPAPPPKKAKKAAPPADDEDEPAPAAKKKPAGKDNGLGDLVSEWDDPA